jgi:hypothetical protein
MRMPGNWQVNNIHVWECLETDKETIYMYENAWKQKSKQCTCMRMPGNWQGNNIHVWECLETDKETLHVWECLILDSI